MFAIYLDSSYFFQLFFLEFLAILLDCSLFLSGWTGCPGSQPDPDPNISPTSRSPTRLPNYCSLNFNPGRSGTSCKLGQQLQR